MKWEGFIAIFLIFFVMGCIQTELNLTAISHNAVGSPTLMCSHYCIESCADSEQSSNVGQFIENNTKYSCNCSCYTSGQLTEISTTFVIENGTWVQGP